MTQSKVAVEPVRSSAATQIILIIKINQSPLSLMDDQLKGFLAALRASERAS